MGKKLSNAPLYYTVVQVQFNPILNLDSFMPAIQSEMRGLGFPDYKREVRQRFFLNPDQHNPNSQSVPSIIQENRNLFGDIEGLSKFILDNNALTFETTNYETYETFVKCFSAGLGVVHNIINLAFTERVGLRYLDAVFPLNGEPLNEYLVNEVRGLKNMIAGNFVHTYTETVTENDAGQLISRVIIRNGAVGLPEDLAMQHVRFAHKFVSYEGEHAIIDSDAFTLMRQPFSLDGIKKTLEKLHINAGDSFKASVSDYALQTWQ
ncbi:TIGR04255 family protein [Methylophilus aquaticus]|uniref:TIGR04255 family protein n=1 Tax=Methylophilus aquaticus TaxID=1971610 RepID=A0ABT9JNV8_9PROT|nr:TIGR04255 family protein [Methylophilus aquaticus]MDP8566282.1 TIGR04255 family protein [Methylophilus aquaticus]